MSSLLQKIKIWFAGLRKSNVSYEKKGIRPEKDWKTILTSTFIAVFILALLSFYFYTQVESGSIFNVDDKDLSSDVKINDSLMRKVVGDSNRRSEVFQSIRNGKSYSQDPSL